MCFWADESSVPMADKVIVARKAHRCVECDEPIRSGEPHRYYKGIYDGQFFQARWCARCEFVRHLIHYVEREIEKCDEWESWPMQLGALSDDWRDGNYWTTLGLLAHEDDDEPSLNEVPRW